MSNNSTIQVATITQTSPFLTRLFLVNSILLTAGTGAFLGSCAIILVILRYPSLRKLAEGFHLFMYLAFADGLNGIRKSHMLHYSFFRDLHRTH